VVYSAGMYWSRQFRIGVVAGVLAGICTVAAGVCAGQVLPTAAGTAGASDGLGACGAVLPSAPIAGTPAGKGITSFPSYLEDSFVQLKKEVPNLRGLRIAEDPTSLESQTILSQMSTAISEMLPKVPHLVAKEELTQVVLPLPYSVGGATQGMTTGGRRGGGIPTYNSSERGVEGEELQHVMHTMLTGPGNHFVFNYRIQSDPDPKYGLLLNEYRYTTKNEPVDVQSVAPGNPHGIGFSNSWLLFEPSTMKESRFRYLGRQKVGKRETFVVAFAQSPGLVKLPGRITIGGSSCRYFTQGVVWIDQQIFQIVRLQTDLLAPLPDIHLKQLRSELQFNEVRIKERALSLWLPNEVSILWETQEVAAAEMHHYSNYKLFTGSGRLLP
jgi:hypothetical protein